jgi:hypothetical protein
MSFHNAGWLGTRLATALWLIGAVVFGSSARAGLIQFAPQGSSGATYTIGGLDPGPGNALAVSAVPLTVGATFQLDYQAVVPALIGANGLDFTPPGLGSTYQLTAVGSFTEVVTSLGASGTVATFALAPAQSSNSFFEVYYNSAVVANNLAGTGFNVGTLVLAGTPATNLPNVSVFSISTAAGLLPFDQFNQSNYQGISSVDGSGSSLLFANVNYYNPAFIGTPINEIAFNASIVTPFNEVDPSRLFVGSPGTAAPSVVPNIGTIDGVTGTDFQFQADGNFSFNGNLGGASTPEPSSVILAAMGFLGALCFAACMRK